MASNTWRVIPDKAGESWWAMGPRRDTREEAERDAEHGSMLGALQADERDRLQRADWIPVADKLPAVDVFVAVLYRRQGVLVPAVARWAEIAWVTPQAIAVDARYWSPLPALPEEAQ